MMNHIAVILRGHMRTFGYTKDIMFNFYNKIAKNVDYYVVTWEIPGLNIDSIKSHFKYSNLVALVRVPANSTVYNSWIGPGWLSYNIVPYKRQRERKVTYDAVFDTRPDVVYQLTGKSIIVPEPDSLYTTLFTNLPKEDELNKNCIGLADHFMIMPSDVYDKLSCRYIVKNVLGCHAQLKQVCNDENINTCIIDWIQAKITRPNAIERIPDPNDYFQPEKTGVSWPEIQAEWAGLDARKKLYYINSYGINPEDYFSSDSVAKL